MNNVCSIVSPEQLAFQATATASSSAASASALARGQGQTVYANDVNVNT